MFLLFNALCAILGSNATPKPLTMRFDPEEATHEALASGNCPLNYTPSHCATVTPSLAVAPWPPADQCSEPLELHGVKYAHTVSTQSVPQ